jgi:hypothetical protein
LQSIDHGRPAIFLPGPHEQGQNPVMEQIEPIAESGVFVPLPRQKQGCVVLREDAIRPREAAERGPQLGWLIVGTRHNLRHRSFREPQGGRNTTVDRFLFGSRIPSEGHTAIRNSQPLQQPNRLEEIEPSRSREEPG